MIDVTVNGTSIIVLRTAHRSVDWSVLRATAWYERTRPDDAVPHWPDLISAEERR